LKPLGGGGGPRNVYRGEVARVEKGSVYIKRIQ